VAAQMGEQMPAGPAIHVGTGGELAADFEARGDPATATQIRAERPEALYDPRIHTVFVIAEDAAPAQARCSSITSPARSEIWRPLRESAYISIVECEVFFSHLEREINAVKGSVAF
jgi:hypothetical protein